MKSVFYKGMKPFDVVSKETNCNDYDLYMLCSPHKGNIALFIHGQWLKLNTIELDEILRCSTWFETALLVGKHNLKKTPLGTQGHYYYSVSDFSPKKETQPPLGVSPMKFAIESRYKQVEAAKLRYVNANKPYPKQWDVELSFILDLLSPENWDGINYMGHIRIKDFRVLFSEDRIYDVLADKLGLNEVDFVTNQYVDKNGNYFILTKYGFKPMSL